MYWSMMIVLLFNMMIDLDQLLAKGVFGIGDAIGGGGVYYNTEGGLVEGVVTGLVLLAEEGNVVRVVAVEEQNLLFGIGQL